MGRADKDKSVNYTPNPPGSVRREPVAPTTESVP